MDFEPGLTLRRQWAMLRVIPRAPLKTTTGEIAAKLADDGFVISRRTIERDLQTLSGAFPLVVDDGAKPFGWSWAKDANFEFTPRLTTSQAVALLLAQSHARNFLPSSLLKDLTPIFDGASQALAGSGWHDWHQRTAVIPNTLSLMPPKVALSVMDVVQHSLARKRCIEADYRSKGSDTSTRWHIHPLGLMMRGPVLYLVCTLENYDDVRQLALHRLDKAVERPELRREPAGFIFKQYAKQAGAHIRPQGRIRLVCRFDAPAAEHLRETPLSADQTWSKLQGTGLVEIAATVEDDERLRWWLLAFGSQVEVVSPEDLRDSIMYEAMATYSIYQRGRPSLCDQRSITSTLPPGLKR